MVELWKRDGLAMRLVREAIREGFLMELTTWGWTSEKNGEKGSALDEDRTNKHSHGKKKIADNDQGLHGSLRRGQEQ